MIGNVRAQGLIKYTIILVLVHVVVLAVLMLTGPRIDSVFDLVSSLVARDDLFESPLDTRATFDVLSNDSLPSGRSVPLNVPYRTGEGGTLTIDTENNIVYEPPPGFFGHDSFVYSVSDLSGMPDEANVTIAVGEVPVARADKACAIIFTPLTIDLIANDTGGAFPIDPATIEVTPIGFTAPYIADGTILFNNNLDGTLTYTFTTKLALDDEEETTVAEFEYTFANTANEGSNPARVSIETKDLSQECLETPETVAMTDLVMTAQTAEDTLDPGQLAHEANERLSIFADQVNAQNTLFADTFDLGLSSLDAFIDLFLAHAISSGDDDLVQEIIGLQQELDAENYDDFYAALPDLADDFYALPLDAKSALVLAIEPVLIDSCLALSAARVPSASFYAAGNALARVEADDPGRATEAISKLVTIWDQVEERHQLIDESRPILAQVTEIGISFLFLSGDEELVAQALAFEAMSRPCSIGWEDLDQAISAALIKKKGIRKSLLHQADEAQAAYDLGYYQASAEILNALLNHLNAQDGKHIDPASAAAIRDTVLDLAAGLAIPLPN